MVDCGCFSLGSLLRELELDPTTHEEHVEIVEGYRNVLEFPVEENEGSRVTSLTSGSMCW